jgi:DNA-binding NarL/FixJ family response regulator
VRSSVPSRAAPRVRPLRILVADDHDVVRRGVRALLESQPGWQVVAEAADGGRAVELARRLRPDVAVLDLAMAGMDGIEAARLIRHHSPPTEVVALTVYESPEVLRQVSAAGARGYVAKADAARTLVAAVSAVAQQGAFVTPRVAGMARTRPLTAREREVLRLLAEGLRAREVAERLGIKPKTVETHRASLLRKLRLRNLGDLVRYAVRNGFVEA